MSDNMESMSVDSQQASEMLEMIQKIQVAAKKSLASGQASSVLMLWGAIWFLAFLGCYYCPRYYPIIWIVSSLTGCVGMGGLFFLQRKQIRAKSIASQKLGWRVFWFWFLLFVYGEVFLTLLWTDRGFRNSQISAFICTLVMFAYVMIGLLMDAKLMLWLGLAVTVLIVIGYLFVNSFFDLWMAPAGGGALFLTGLYMRLKWRTV